MDDVLPATALGPATARRTVLVVAMTVALLGLAVLIGHPFVNAVPFLGSVHLPWWALAIGFAATEACVLHLQVKREAQTVSDQRAAARPRSLLRLAARSC